VVAVATVDPADDGIWRYVVRWYAYDPDRHERRHQAVAAFDNKREGDTFLHNAADELRRHRDGGDPVDPRERYSAVMLEPGHRRRHQDRRILMQAIRHGANIDLRRLELLPHVGVVQAVESAPAADVSRSTTGRGPAPDR
jgi:hypothetical protein